MAKTEDICGLCAIERVAASSSAGQPVPSAMIIGAVTRLRAQSGKPRSPRRWLQWPSKPRICSVCGATTELKGGTK